MINYISSLYGKLDIISKCKILNVIVELAEMKEDLFDNICTFNEAVIVLQRAHDTLVDAIGRCSLSQLHTSSTNVAVSIPNIQTICYRFPQDIITKNHLYKIQYQQVW